MTRERYPFTTYHGVVHLIDNEKHVAFYVGTCKSHLWPKTVMHRVNDETYSNCNTYQVTEWFDDKDDALGIVNDIKDPETTRSKPVCVNDSNIVEYLLSLGFVLSEHY